MATPNVSGAYELLRRAMQRNPWQQQGGGFVRCRMVRLDTIRMVLTIRKVACSADCLRCRRSKANSRLLKGTKGRHLACSRQIMVKLRGHVLRSDRKVRSILLPICPMMHRIRRVAPTLPHSASGRSLIACKHLGIILILMGCLRF